MRGSVPVYFLAAAVGAQVGRTAAEHEMSSLLYLCATWRWRGRLEASCDNSSHVPGAHL